jgi:glycerol kinase
MAEKLLLALDQGTTSTRAILFDGDGALRASAQQELPQHYPQPGWVEHDPEEIWDSALRVIRRVLINAKIKGGDIAAIGITNQRETTILWDRETGAPIHRAIVWQDRRTAEWCRRMAKNMGDAELGQRTGLLFDAYFSGSKIAWLLDNVAGARRAANQGKLAFGTIDAFLLWRLTGGKAHATDATNASRTMLFNLETLDWDDTLLREFDIPRSLLPEIRDSAADFGETDKSLFGATIPVRGIAGDQHAAAFGQACFNPGMVKSTYGTGCFVLVNTGAKRVRSKNRMLSTLAWRLGGKPTYALEGSIFISGAAIQWLRDGLKVIAKAGDTEAIAAKLKDTGGVYLVPAFTGLGAPYWDPDARGAILGLTRATGQAEIVRAALEATAYQTRDLIDAMSADLQSRNKDGVAITALRVDGGMVVNNWLMQFLADQVGVPVERPAITETTALGAAFLAGLGSGIFRSTDEIARKWRRDRRFETELSQTDADLLYEGWKAAVARVRSTAEPARKKR